jgi:transcriptional regulator with XRE-family HTH domain
MNLSNKIIELRSKNKLTQEELAEKLNVSRQTVSNWETGKCYPDIETLIIMSNKFNISLDELLKDNIKMVKEVDKKVKIASKLKYVLAIVLIISILVGVFLVKSNVEANTKIDKYEKQIEEMNLTNIPDGTTLFRLKKEYLINDIKFSDLKVNTKVKIYDKDKKLITSTYIVLINDEDIIIAPKTNEYELLYKNTMINYPNQQSLIMEIS